MRPQTPDLSVVLVSYNVRAFVARCLASLAAGAREHTQETILVDNASRDGSAELVRHAFPQVRVIEMGGNGGFARASNRGLAAARGRNLLLLNCDTQVEPGALDSLIRFLDANPAAGVAAPRLLNPDRSDQGTARSFPTAAAALFGRRSLLTRLFPRNRWSRRYLSGRDRSGAEPFEVDWVSGACLMLRREVLERVGPLDEGFFLYWEDADWCRRIRAAGLGVYCVPEAEVVHYEGSSRRGWPPAQVWTFHKSVFRYYAKHHAKGWWNPLRPPVAAALAARAALLMLSASIPRLPASTRPWAKQPETR